METKNTRQKIKFSKNTKLNAVLSAIHEGLQELGENEVKRYKQEFKHEIDFNIAQYGNLLCYYSDIFKFYKTCGYKSLSRWSCEKIWRLYLRQVGFIARYYFN